MNSSTEGLLNLIEKYQQDVPKKEEVKTNQNTNKKNNIFFEYSPVKVEYFKYNNYIYRREVDSQGNISWEILKGNVSNKIQHPMQIQHLEEKIL